MSEVRSTKACTRCGNTALGLMRTLRVKYCPDCGNWMDWPLDKGQKPLLEKSRVHDRRGTRR